MTWEKEGFVLSDDSAELYKKGIHELLSTTYWASERSKDEVQKVISHSLCFCVTKDDELVGFVRVISDYTKMSWISDMVIKKGYRGQQLGYWMMKVVMAHPELKNTQFALQTKDAHSFYAKLGFSQRPTLMSTSASYL